ncbi:MAG: hypothetical protein ABJB01_08255 [Rudaea sp.]
MNRTRTALTLFFLLLAFASSHAGAGQHSGIRALYGGPSALETCVIMADHRPYCWGQTPAPLPAVGGDVTALALGQSFRCALTMTGKVLCWGNNGSGQLGDGTFTGRDTPQPVQYSGADMTRVTAVSAGTSHVCALRDGAAWCWGDNATFQIGNYSLPSGSDAALPMPVLVHGSTSSPPLANLIYLGAGSFHTCALLADKTGACWGNGHEGELGNNIFLANQNSPQTVWVDSGGLQPLVMGGERIQSGGYSTCALVSDINVNSVACWGLNNEGQLGTGNTFDRATAVPAQDERGKITDATTVAVGRFFACATVADSTVRCWGSDASFQLGTGAAGSDQLKGTKILMPSGAPLTGAVQVVAGALHVCALTFKDEVYCWGDNTYGQVGGGFGQKVDVPTRMAIDAPMFTENFDAN